MLIGEVCRNEDTGLESTVICIGMGMKKKVTLNTTAVQQKHQVCSYEYKQLQISVYMYIY